MANRRPDPIIAELRAARDRHAAECGYDVAAIFEDIRCWQAESGREFVRLPPRPPKLQTRDPQDTT